MFLGMLMMFCLFAGLALIFGANFLQNRDRLRALLMIAGALMSIIPLAVVLISFFYPIWE
jgi:hypothetical protein